MAVPPRHVGRRVARHRTVLDDDVLQDLVERRSEVDVTVGVGRTVVEDEARPVRVVSEQTLVETDRLPARKDLRLARGKVRTHGEIRARQIERRLVVHTGARHATSEVYRFQRQPGAAQPRPARPERPKAASNHGEPPASAGGDGGPGASEERSPRSGRAPHGPPGVNEARAKRALARPRPPGTLRRGWGTRSGALRPRTDRQQDVRGSGPARRRASPRPPSRR